MKVLILNHFERLSPRVHFEIKSLHEIDYKVEILYWNRNGSQYQYEERYAEKEERLNFKAPSGTLMLILFLPLFYWKLIKLVIRKDFDVMHFTHILFLPLAVLVKKIKRTKVVYDAYERYAIDISYTYFPKFPTFARTIIEFLENRLVSNLDGILVVDSPKGLLEKRYSKYNGNVQVLYNVPENLPFAESRNFNSLRCKYKNQRIVIYVGGLSKERGLIKMIESFHLIRKKIHNVKLLLIGSFQDSKEEAVDLIGKYDLNNNVEIIDWLPYDEMRAYLNLAEVALASYQPSARWVSFASRGTATKLFDYMERGLPIVASDFGEISLVVREEKSGLLVDSTKAEAIADATIYLLEHPEEAKAMGERGQQAFDGKYNWSIEKKKLFKVYEKIVKT